MVNFAASAPPAIDQLIVSPALRSVAVAVITAVPFSATETLPALVMTGACWSRCTVTDTDCSVVAVPSETRTCRS